MIMWIKQCCQLRGIKTDFPPLPDTPLFRRFEVWSLGKLYVAFLKIAVAHRWGRGNGKWERAIVYARIAGVRSRNYPIAFGKIEFFDETMNENKHPRNIYTNPLTGFTLVLQMRWKCFRESPREFSALISSGIFDPCELVTSRGGISPRRVEKLCFNKINLTSRPRIFLVIDFWPFIFHYFEQERSCSKSNAILKYLQDKKSVF